MKNKTILKVFAFLPLILEVALVTLISLGKFSWVMWTIHIPIIISLWVIGEAIITNKKSVEIIGGITLIALTIGLCIIGYYDYLQWFTTKVGLGLFAYFILLWFLDKKTKNK